MLLNTLACHIVLQSLDYLCLYMVLVFVLPFRFTVDGCKSAAVSSLEAWKTAPRTQGIFDALGELQVPGSWMELGAGHRSAAEMYCAILKKDISKQHLQPGGEYQSKLLYLFGL